MHRRYNPAGVSAFNIVPALLGVILTMTMVMITSIALTRETERGHDGEFARNAHCGRWR